MEVDFVETIFLDTEKEKCKTKKSDFPEEKKNVFPTSSPFLRVTPTPSGSYIRSFGVPGCNDFFLGKFNRNSGSIRS